MKSIHRDDPAPLILVGTEDVDFYLFVDHVLNAENIATDFAAGAEDIVLSAQALNPQAILLDCRGHTHLGDEICAPLRQNGLTRDIPIVALIDPSAERRYIQLIKSGIDNILVRPVLPAKLIDSVRAILPGSPAMNGFAGAGSKAVRYADVEMDFLTYRVRCDGQEVHLSPIEFKLLRHLLERPEQVVTREELHGAAWPGNAHVGPRTVDVHVGRLRKVLRSGCKEGLIRTVRSVGYALSVQAMDDATPSL